MKLIRSKTPETIAFALSRRYGVPQDYDTVTLPGWGWITIKDSEFEVLYDYIVRLLNKNLICIINIPDGTDDDISDILDNILWQDSVKSKEAKTPPANPLFGTRYLLFYPDLNGDWQTHHQCITEYRQGQGWVYIDPREGMRVWVEDENTEYVYNGSEWVPSDTAQDSSEVAHSGNIIAVPAVVNIPAFVTVTNEGTRATTTNPHHATRILGVSVEDALAGHLVKVVRSGVIENPAWTFNPNAVIYLNGEELSEIAPHDGFIVKIGITLNNPTALVVDISRGVLL